MPIADSTFDLEKTEPPRYRAFRYTYHRQYVIREIVRILGKQVLTARSTIEVRKLDPHSWVIVRWSIPPIPPRLTPYF